jgi:N-acylneuraminate cytidylyltransferase
MIQEELKKKLSNIKMVITDIDGVLTDGGMYYSENGDELKKFNVRDGVGVALLRKSAIYVGAITGESVRLNKKRAEKIQLDFFYEGISDKLNCFTKCCKEKTIDSSKVLYIGDEINDISLISNAGLFLCPSDANPVIIDKADFVLKSNGGQGVLREAALMILTAQNILETALKDYTEDNKRK